MAVDAVPAGASGTSSRFWLRFVARVALAVAAIATLHFAENRLTDFLQNYQGNFRFNARLWFG